MANFVNHGRIDEDGVFVVAELSANHNHSLDVALESVRAAKKAGADAVKIQTYTADTITIDCDNQYFQIRQGTVWDGTTLYKLYKDAFTPWEWHQAIKDEVCGLGMTFFSTPFDNSAVDFLEGMDVPMYKIASYEITDIPLIEYAASKGKPMIISSGIATREEIREAVDACRRSGSEDITLLKCTSDYPAKAEEANLSTMDDMRESFGVRVGISDHSLGPVVAVCAVARGARVVEKHFILDRSKGGPDATFSMEPAEFRAMVDQVRIAETTIGKPTYFTTQEPIGHRAFSRSLFAVEDIGEGETLTRRNVRSIRPGYGLSPSAMQELIGKKASRSIPRGTPLSWDCVSQRSES